MNRKGFTLVELLAALVILSLLMVMAAPTILNLLDNNKMTTYLEDGKKLAVAAEYKMKSTTKIVKPAAGSCIIVNMEYLQSSDFEESPNGGYYDQLASFVLVKRNDDRSLEYYVRLAEKVDKGYMGINFAKYEDLSQSNSRELVEGFREQAFEIYASNPTELETLKTKIKNITYETISKENKKIATDVCNNISAVYYLD